MEPEKRVVGQAQSTQQLFFRIIPYRPKYAWRAGMMRLLLATNNPGKLVEMQDLLSGLSLELITQHLIGLKLDVDETGAT